MNGPVTIAAFLSLFLAAPFSQAGAQQMSAEIDRRVEQVAPRVVEWRRDIHQHPELGNRETRTAGMVAEHLRRLGMEVETGVAHTGVVGVLRGGKPGPVVALRADMDALPVTEQVDVPFASRVRSTYNGQEVGVMHACGHDTHVAMLMGAAEVLAGMRDRLPGTVKFIFQPAEEGPPPGEEGGAAMMVKEGVLANPKPDAVFGLHVGVFPKRAGHISYRPAGSMASADNLKIVVHGRQTHGAAPWAGVDPIVVASQIVGALQTITSRQVNTASNPAIVTIGTFQGGVRHNIIPDSVVLTGTVRAFDKEMQADIHQRIRRMADLIARSAEATADVTITEGAALTYNDPALTDRMSGTLRRVAGVDKVSLAPLVTGAEDFSYYQQQVPGLFFFLGVAPEGVDLATVAPNHSPHFFVDESALPVGVRALSHLAVDFLTGRNGKE